MVASDVGGAGHTVGHVVAVQGATVTGQLFDQSPIGLPPVVIGDLVAMPAGKGRAYGVVNGLRCGRHGEDHDHHREGRSGEPGPSHAPTVGMRRTRRVPPSADARRLTTWLMTSIAAPSAIGRRGSWSSGRAFSCAVDS